MLRERLIFGPLMIVGLLLAIWADAMLDRVDLTGTAVGATLGWAVLPSGLIFFAIVLVSTLLMAGELQRLFQAKGADTSRLTTALSAGAGCVLMYTAPPTMSAQGTLALFATVMVVVFLFSLFRHCWGGITDGALHAGGAGAFAFVYLGVLVSFYLVIRRDHSPWLIMAMVLIIKSADIGAYAVGRAIGRHRLIPWLSPAKTWEGLIGGLIVAALVAVGLTALGNVARVSGHWVVQDADRVFIDIDYPLWFGAGAGLVMALVGQVGDLIASLLKRDAGIKDAGNTIPGFGGLIDVLDSPILVAPLAYWLIQLAPILAR